ELERQRQRIPYAALWHWRLEATEQESVRAHLSTCPQQEPLVHATCHDVLHHLIETFHHALTSVAARARHSQSPSPPLPAARARSQGAPCCPEPPQARSPSCREAAPAHVQGLHTVLARVDLSSTGAPQQHRTR